MPEAFIDVAYLRQVAAAFQAEKEYTYDQMEIQPGQHLLDIGCGPGVDTVPLAKLLKNGGQVTGVDIDPKMIEAADEWAAEHGVSSAITHILADVAQLPFSDNHFDAVRAERLFQVIPEEYGLKQVFPEMVRVVKPGGRIVVADTDWATFSINCPDHHLERKMTACFRDVVRPNGYAGRQINQAAINAGLQVTDLKAFPLIQKTFKNSPFDVWLIEQGLAGGAITKADADQWREVCNSMEEKGTYYSVVNMMITTAVK